MCEKNKTPIGYSCRNDDDFASSLHISKNMAEAADTIVTGNTIFLDIGQFNDDHSYIGKWHFQQTCPYRDEVAEYG